MRRVRRLPNNNQHKKYEKRRLCPYCKMLIPLTRYDVHVSKACKRRPIVGAQGNIKPPQWVEMPCLECKTEIYIHIEWENPSLLCKECYAKTWIKEKCRICKAEVIINVHWVDPLLLCKRCRARRRVELRGRPSQKNGRFQRSPSKRMGSIGKSVVPNRPTVYQGGLPSLGKR